MLKPTREDAGEVLFTVGVDTHLEEHVAVALDHLGRRPDVQRYGRVGTDRDRGRRSLGAGFARFLRARAVEVLEVGRPKRRASIARVSPTQLTPS